VLALLKALCRDVASLALSGRAERGLGKCVTCVVLRSREGQHRASAGT